MVTLNEILEKRDEILEIANRYGAHDVRIFGSVACRETSERSDVDLIVRFDSDRSLLDHGGLIMDLRDLLDTKVDVISEAGMRPRFRNAVLKEAIAL